MSTAARHSLLRLGLVMTTLFGLAGATDAALAAPASTPVVTTSAPYAGYARSRLLAVPRAGLAPAEMDKSLKPMGARARALIRALNVQMIELPAGLDEVATLKKLRQSRKFKYVELDMAVTPVATVSDPGFSGSWGLAKIGAPTAWNTATGEGIVVAVLDTGVDSSHPDLVDNMVPGWNTYDNNSNSADVYGHGTQVSGVVAMSANNGIGGAGVAYNAKVMPIRITDTSGYGYFSTMAAGVYWAADHGARVANISFSGVAGSSTVDAAAQYMRGKGGVVVVAAGNTGTDLGYASYANLIVASATDSSDLLASFSSFGNFVDVAAPGVSIYTTKNGGGYGYASGTSFASPMTAATAALILSANPGLSAADVVGILQDSARDLGLLGLDTLFGHGRIDAAAAVAEAQARVSADSTAPVVAVTSPVGGTTLVGVVGVDVNASDNRGVANVSLYLNGQKVASDTTAPFAFSLDTSRYPNGAYTLSADASDAAGNVTASAPVSVLINNPVTQPGDTVAPVITIFSVTDGKVVTRYNSMNVSGKATDNVKVVQTQILIDGVVKASSATDSVSYKLMVKALTNGQHTVTVKARDAAGNTVVKTATIVK